MKESVACRWFGTLLLFGALAASSGFAEAGQAITSGQSLVFDPDRLHQGIDATAFAPDPSSKAAAEPAAKAAPKPAKANPPSGSSNTRAVLAPGQDAARKAVAPREPVVIRESSVPLGRIPLQSGSFGFDAGTKSNAREFPDGRRIPAYDTLKREGGMPFIGLSLSVPTSSMSGFGAPRKVD